MSDVTTVGTLLINDSLPEELKKSQHRLDKKAVHKLFGVLAEKYPEQYKEVLHRLSEVGRKAVWTEGMSVSLADLVDSPAREALLEPVRQRVRQITQDPTLTHEQRKDQLVGELTQLSSKLQDAVLAESRERGSSFAAQIDSGARGSKSALASLKGADLLTTDHRGRFVALPLLKNYTQGFSPAEYFAASYGQRAGQLAVKMSVADAGYMTKRLVNAAHRQAVTRDTPRATRLPTGLPVDTSDADNVGGVLAVETEGYPAGTVLTDEILQDLQDKEVDQILLSSPMTEFSEDGGISAWAAGRRTRRGLHQIGDNIGVPAAQALGERLSQGLLSAKHTAGIADRVSRSGVEYLNRLLDSPDNFPEAGPLVEEDGLVTDVRKASQGGHYIRVGERDYYVPEGVEPTVKIGQQVEQGDDLTDGVPRPDDLVRLRGLGEARRTYLRHFKQALEDSGVKSHRRNVESVVSGLLDWARVTNPEGLGEHLVDDVVPYGSLIAAYQPRQAAQELPANKAVGQYLEEPVLHYTPGTRITRKVAEDLKRWKIAKIYAHQEPPDFEPFLVRSVESVSHDPDWRVRQAGFYTARAFQDSVRRGRTSDTDSTSYIPSLTAGTADFGRNLSETGRYGAGTGTPPKPR